MLSALQFMKTHAKFNLISSMVAVVNGGPPPGSVQRQEGRQVLNPEEILNLEQSAQLRVPADASSDDARRKQVLLLESRARMLFSLDLHPAAACT